METLEKTGRRLKERFLIEVTSDGFSAYNEKGTIYTVAKDREELFENILEAANLYYEDYGRVLDRNDIEVRIDFKEFFRKFDYLKASSIAKRSGINSSLISQYVKGSKQPSEKQTEKLLSSINEIGNELSAIHF